jgi:L-ascorbate metabolism protein UlaG (beta-lactamase superfamily)
MHFGTFPVLTGTPEAFKTEMQKTRAKTSLKNLQVGERLRWETK